VAAPPVDACTADCDNKNCLWSLGHKLAAAAAAVAVG